MPAPTASGHELRRTRVGASEVGALMGFHPYQAPADVWARLVGAAKPKPETAAMLAGNLMEEPVAGMWSRQHGRKVVRCSRTYAHPEVALCATPDYYVPHHELLEVKVSGDYDLWSSLPEYVYWQAQAQLALTGRVTCHVAAFVGGSLRTYVVPAEYHDQARMLVEVDAFVRQHVLTRQAPAGASGELVLKVAGNEGTVAATDQEEALAVALWLARDAETTAGAAAKAHRDALAGKLAETGARQMLGRGWTFGLDARGALTFRGKPGGLDND